MSSKVAYFFFGISRIFVTILFLVTTLPLSESLTAIIIFTAVFIFLLLVSSLLRAWGIVIKQPQLIIPNAIQADAIVNQIESTGISKDGNDYGYSISLTVYPPNSSSFSATIHTLLPNETVIVEGQKVQVIYDQKDPINMQLDFSTLA